MNRKSVALVALCLTSLVLTTSVNRAAGEALARIAPGRLGWIADACIPSCLAGALIYVMARPGRPFGRPAPGTPRARIYRIGAVWLAIWLLGSAAVAVARGRWIAYTHGAASIAGFVVIAPIGEELLFRGAIYEIAERALPGRARAPLLVASTFFALHHLQLHGFRLDGPALAQVSFAFPMGIVFGRLRGLSQSIWPGLALHVLTNLPGAFGA